jgi:hypothetical protein
MEFPLKSYIGIMAWRENVIYKTTAEHTAHMTLNNSQSKENRYKNKQINNKS